MSTPKMTDNELDALFKQAAEERDVPFDAQAWAKMQNKLRVAWYWRWAKNGLWLGLGLGLVVSSWLIFRPQTIDNKLPLNADSKLSKSNSLSKTQSIDNQIVTKRQTTDQKLLENTNSKDEAQNIDASKKAQNTDNQVIVNQQTNNSKQQLNADYKLNKKLQNTDNQVIVGFQTISENSKLNSNSKKIQDTDNQVVNTIENNKINFGSDSLNKSQTTDNQVVNKIENNKINFSSDSLNKSQTTDNQVVKINSIDIEPLKPSFISHIPDSLSQKTKSRQSTARRLAIQVYISPDWSTVGMAKKFQIGGNFGLSAEYRIFKQFTMTLGANYSNKVYNAAPEQYKPYSGYWQLYPKPDDIDGSCKVLEVPINIRYYALNFSKSKIFLSSGISSYWMLQERYQYNYSNYPYPKVKEVEGENKHLFSVVNASVGLEKNLTRHLRLQIEPFIKIPLAGVGYGKVKLVSAGAFLTLKYQFLKTL